MSDSDSNKSELNKKETKDLLQIWVKNDRSQWRSDAFDAIKEILIERGVEVPIQSTPFVEVKQPKTTLGTAVSIFGIVAVLVGEVLRKILPEPFNSILFTLIGGAVTGLLVGLVPFFVALKKNRGRFAKGSLISSAIIGSVFGLVVAAPLAIILTIVALVQTTGKKE